MYRILVLLTLTAGAALGQCNYQLSQTSVSVPATHASAPVVTITAGSSCAWTSVSNVNWITVSFGQAGTGNGSMSFTVADNPTPAARNGTLTIAGITFTVMQAAGSCTYALSPTSANIGPGAGTGSFTVTTSCSWTAASNNSDWLTITTGTSGSGTGAVQYSAAANATGAARVGTITAGGQTFTVNQSGACAYTLNPVGAQVAATGGTGTFTVTANSTSCAWTATSNNPDFISVTSGSPGSGNGSVGYSVLANNSPSPRSGSISVGSTTFVIYQPGGQPCTYTLTSTSASFTSSGGTSSFSVTSTCTWTATTSATWVAFSVTNSTVTFTVAPNASTSSRAASIMVGSQSFTINEGGVPCSVSVAPLTISVPTGGGSGSIAVTAPDGCNWSAVSSVTWVSLGATSGSGQGNIPYMAMANSVGQVRTGTITIANQVVTVSEDAAACGQSLSPDHATVAATSGTYQFAVSTNCPYTAASTAGWINVTSGPTGTTGGNVGYTVSANTSPDPRTGTITVGSQTFTVAQSGTGCTLSLSPLTLNIGPAGGSGTFNVTASNSCIWEPSANVAWIHFTYQSINGTGRVNLTADPNDSTSARSGTIVISGQNFQLLQAGRPLLQFDKTSVLNSASFVNGPVAPGEIITIFGAGIGPNPGLSYQLTPNNLLITQALGGVQVLFDGQPAPLIYVSASQISAIVPYEVNGQTSTQVQVQYLGFPSTAVTLDVAPTSPALFTLDTSGSGPGAILNQDASVNSASNPASKGSIVVLWGTGDGQTAPPGTDGLLTTPPLPKPTAQVSVTIGGVAAALQYAGEAPGLPAGVLQINAVVPSTVASGALPVVVKIGAAQTTNNVTVAVQ